MPNKEAADGTFVYPSSMLNLEYTLSNGQMFRWRKAEGGWWDAVSGGNLMRIRLAGTEDGCDRFEYATLPRPNDVETLRRFLRLDVDLAPVYEGWQIADPYLGTLAQRFAGLRLILQDPEECLLGFMCSTANFIPRIMKAVALIARTYGEPITDTAGKVWTHQFPRASVIAELDPYALAEQTGLEWRAGNLVKVAAQIAKKPQGWLDDIAKLDYATARGELQRIDGVGPKIADCVCLFAMAKDQAVPVDTHVWQLTRDRYLPALRGKSLTPAGYAQVLQYFHTHFDKAGWAQQYLFYDHLLESRAKRGSRES